MKDLKFAAGKDAASIKAIVMRVASLIEADDTHGESGGLNRLTLIMDISATHANGCELDLQKLLDANDFDLCHDVFGISQNLNRETGQLGNYFLPRCSKKTRLAKKAGNG